MKFRFFHRPTWDTLMILERIEEMSARSDELLARITANTDALRSIAMAADALNEGQVSIEEKIEELKAQIASGGEADFAPIETAASDQSAVIDGLAAAISKGTVIENPE